MPNINPIPTIHRFLERTEITETCWNWTGTLDPHGYGIINGEGRKMLAHRYAYETLVREIPKGLHLDHLCRNHRCVNPAHLEPVTPAENNRRSTSPTALNARKTHCKRGHAFDADNTILTSGGWRKCRACQTTPNKKAARTAIPTA